jgi:hypothetical protein
MYMALQNGGPIPIPWWLSEEFSSRVAESTRLILVKDGFGGDLGVLDRWTDERRKDTKI